MIRLGNIAKVIAGQAAPKEFGELGLPFIRAGHLQQLLSGVNLDRIPKVSDSVAKKKRLKIIPKGTIIFAKSGMSATKNRIYITVSETYFVSHLAGILPSEHFSNSFLARFLSWYNPSNLILDSAYPSIRLEDINNLKVQLPPLPEQKKIAAILDAADSYSQKTKALIVKYEELTQSLFLDMFGDPVTNPKGWEVKKLEELTSKIGSGSTPRGGKEAYKKEGVSLIRSMNVYDNMFKYKNLAFIDEEQAHKLRNVIVEENDVLFNITGASICRSTVVPVDVLPARVNQHVSILRTIDSLITPKFLSHFLISENVKLKLLGVGSGGGAVMEAITKQQLQTIEVIVPDLSFQNQFAERIKAIESQKTQAQASLSQAEDLFHSLLQMAFKGELTK